ncbi:MAG: tRNA pseudouridine(55) synthase TruB [Thermodesulfobacteriota bacterium]
MPKKENMHGILLVDKPEHMTSNDVVRLVKRLVKPDKVGHTGTLDPAATGLIVILIGSATRSLDYLDEAKKTYRLTVKLGEQTDTDDSEGVVIRTGDPSGITRRHVEQVLGAYRGVIDQVPPHFSAIKRDGVPLYKLARRGVFPELEPRKVEIFSLEVTGWDPPYVDLEMICSKGTYARSLARDIGADLGVGGRLDRLRRLASGTFLVDDAITVEDISADGRDAIARNLISVVNALSHIQDFQIPGPELRRILRGASVSLPKSVLHRFGEAAARQSQLFKIVSERGKLVILVRCEPRGADVLVQPVRVFNTLGNG